ncbi:MAG: chemotaxis protein CheB, partial [Flavobacteriaceae bacterium]|nr:chemotaxis protein CheB [Flavobacteriaceae bacterium]
MAKNEKEPKIPEEITDAQIDKTIENNQKSDLFVVGVGASAGGIDALSRFLSSFNGVTAEFCVVIVMHLSPDYKSELASILTKRCKWPVKTIEQRTKMENRNVYVTPQNSNVHVEGDYLKLDPLPAVYQSAPSVDKFFTSLSQSKGNQAIGVILSGFGSDGSEGLIDIKQNNGFTLAQQPESAEHNSMPSSAISTTFVDLVIPAENMFDEIKRYCKNTRYISASPKKKKSVDAIFELLEKRSGTDFSLYKPSTIMRRINRRMDFLHINSLMEYYEMIKESPRELDYLFDTVLIGVTEFFRDKEAYETLRKQLKALLDKKSPGDTIRFWSVGCATGEEPYSLNILAHEILGSDIGRYTLQIFASDLDERALDFARKGVYHQDSIENLPKEYITKYFD